MAYLQYFTLYLQYNLVQWQHTFTATQAWNKGCWKVHSSQHYSHIWYTYGILHNVYNTIFLIHFAKVCKNRVWLGQLYIWSIYSTHARVSLIFLYPVVGEGNSGKCMSAEICCPAIIIHSHGRAFLYRALLVHFFTKKITELNMIWKRSGVVITLSLR